MTVLCWVCRWDIGISPELANDLAFRHSRSECSHTFDEDVRLVPDHQGADSAEVLSPKSKNVSSTSSGNVNQGPNRKHMRVV